MSGIFCGVPFRINILILLYMNFIWNIYEVGAYFFAFDDSGGSKISPGGSGFSYSLIMTFISMISFIYLVAIVTLHKNEFYMLSLAIVALILDSFLLTYFYSKLINIDLMITWKNLLDEAVVNLPSEYLRKFIEQSMMALLMAVLAIPLSFKILSALILRWYREKLRESFVVLPPFADAILHFAPPPPYNECAGKDDIYCPPPPYSRHPI